jgi:MoxR-like ATPase
MPSFTSPPQDPETLDELSEAYDRLRDEIGKVIVGQEDIIEMVVDPRRGARPGI